MKKEKKTVNKSFIHYWDAEIGAVEAKEYNGVDPIIVDNMNNQIKFNDANYVKRDYLDSNYKNWDYTQTYLHQYFLTKSEGDVLKDYLLHTLEPKITGLESGLSANTELMNTVKAKAEQNTADITTLRNDIRDLGNISNTNQQEINTIKENITHLEQSKQDTLIAGENIEILGNTIKAIIPSEYELSDVEVFAGFWAFGKKVYCRAICGVSTKQFDNIELVSNVSRIISQSFFATNYMSYPEYQELPFYYNNNDRIVIRNDKTQKSIWLHRQWGGSNIPVYYYGTLYYIKENE